jgi:hypothetical protein
MFGSEHNIDLSYVHQINEFPINTHFTPSLRLGRVNDVHELGLERRATDEESVDVRQLRKLPVHLSVLSFKIEKIKVRTCSWRRSRYRRREYGSNRRRTGKPPWRGRHAHPRARPVPVQASRPFQYQSPIRAHRQSPPSCNSNQPLNPLPSLYQRTYFQSSSFNSSTTALSWRQHTASVWPFSRSARVSPMQRMTERPASRAARVFCATISSVSWKSVRRSEWPART